MGSTLNPSLGTVNERSWLLLVGVMLMVLLTISLIVSPATALTSSQPAPPAPLVTTATGRGAAGGGSKIDVLSQNSSCIGPSSSVLKTESVTAAGSADPWWNSNWLKRCPITITGNHPENYQIRVVIPDNVVYKAEYPSIRFLENEDSGVLDFWIEKDEGCYTNVAWVRRNDNSSFGGDSQIWMYYGNPNVTSTECGDNTFLFFDDFGGGNGGLTALNTSKWSNNGQGIDVYKDAMCLGKGYEGYI